MSEMKDKQVTLESLNEKIDILSEKINNLKPLKVSWEDTISESGIQIAGGPTTISRKGTIVGSFGAPVGPNQLLAFFFVKRDDTDEIVMVEVPRVKILS
jgi:hypothetical protein